MSIQRRILLGHLAVASLMLAPAIYAVYRLDSVGMRTSRSLEEGSTTIRGLDRVRSEFEEAMRARRVASALIGPLYDPVVVAQADGALAATRRDYSQVRPSLVAGGVDSQSLERLDALLLGSGPDQSSLPETAEIASPRSSAEGAAPPSPVNPEATRPAASPGTSRTTIAGDHGAPTTPSGGASAAPPASSKRPVGVAGGNPPATAGSAAVRGPREGAALTAGSPGVEADPWTDEAQRAVYRGINEADHRIRRQMRNEAAEIERDALRAGRMGLIGLAIITPLALLFAFLVVRGIHRPLGRLISATSAVASGEFGVSLPVRGNDEMSRLAHAFNRMSQSLAGLERMKADFLSIASHELKTPLTCIKGYAGALRATIPDEAQSGEVSGYLDRIDREADLLSRKVTELLTFGVIEAGQLTLEPREVMTEGFLLMAAEAFRPIAAERKIDFEVEVDGGVPPTFTADPDRLNQVFLNLLDNAFKYTPEGGRVRLSGRESGGRLEIEVRDNGPGIPPAQLSLIFEKYARVRTTPGATHAGTGLGLAVARGIVAAHGGTIEAASEVGKGSQFIVRLPLQPGEIRSRREVA